MLRTLRLSALSILPKPFVLAGLNVTSKTCTSGSSFHIASLHRRQTRLYSDSTERSRPRTKWTPERTAELHRLHDEGLSITSIAHRLQFPPWLVRYKLNSWPTPVPYRERMWRAEDKAEVLRLRDQGMTIKSIAERFQLPYHVVRLQVRNLSSAGSRRKGKWTPEEVDELIRLRAKSWSVKSIADRMRRSCPSVDYKIYGRRPRVEGHRQTGVKYWQEDEIVRIRKIMGRVVKRDEIQALAAELGRSYESVRTQLSKVRRENNLGGSPPPKSGKAWTQDDFDRAQHLREEGRTWSQIGAVLGRSRTSVQSRLANAKVTGNSFNPDHHLSHGELQQIQRFYCEGRDAEEIRRLLPRRSRCTIIRAIERSFGRYEEPAFRGEVKMP
ncbi:hypothetical protein AC578_6135 [Pseudocercospora eumusae]|uniref:HTH myb-type domain-containing protein n=1 Tax=Pseudocercospora eumusae TaxID=321146 RepID=A0A139GXK8_9PEZI|nr:hypothetical protein AC578_6135 [Pseudocercospora eumusae]